MSWITEEEREEYIKHGFTCENCIFFNDCGSEEICGDFSIIESEDEYHREDGDTE